MEAQSTKSPDILRVFASETLINGRPARLECLKIAGQIYAIDRGPIRVIRLGQEWYEDVEDP